MKALALILAVILGAIFGSFTCCQAWRMRYAQKGKKELGKWSVCLSCGHKLSAMENIPVFSWLFLRGKCKKCGAKIGVMEILSEVGLAVIFGLLTWNAWPIFTSGEVLSIIAVALLYIGVVLMWILVLYDAKWGEMPVKILWAAVAVAAVYAVLVGVNVFSVAYLSELVIAGLILPGLYFVLYKASKEALVGSGDWILALAIALFLGNWWLAPIELCVANVLASLWGMWKLLRKKSHKIHFAPFLVTAFILVWIFRVQLLRLFSF